MNIYLEKLRSFSDENKYFKIYCSIIERSKSLYESKKDANNKLGYTEAHHIFPSAFCAEHEIKDANNISHLTAKEHYIVHRLLTKFMLTAEMKNKMIFAVWNMTRKSSNQKRHQVSSRTYNIVKQNMAEAKKGQPAHNKGIPLSEEHKEKLRYVRSEETKRKISKAKKGVPKSEKCKSHLSKINAGENNPFFGKKHSEEIRKQLSLAKTGCKLPERTEEHRQKLSNSLKGRKISEEEKEKRKETYVRGANHPFYGGLPDNMKTVCKHCGITVSKGLHTRWHGEKCKSKVVS
jgi:hypothetical protein